MIFDYFCNLKYKLVILAISRKVMTIFEVFPFNNMRSDGGVTGKHIFPKEFPNLKIIIS